MLSVHSRYDMAYTRNGYKYHSEYDDFKNIELGTYQHTGDNVLELIKSLANAEEVSQPKAQPNKPVFFDFLGLFIIYYNVTAELIINIITIILSILIGCISFYQLGLKFDFASFLYISVIFLTTIISWVVSLIITIGIGAFIDALDKTMSWYRFPFYVIALYCIPAIIVIGLFYLILNRYHSFNKITIQSQAQLYLHIVRMIWTLIVLVGTILQIRSVHILVIPILFTSIAFLILYVSRKQYSEITWITIYLLSTIIPSIFSMYITLEVFGLFIPICGRFGGETNPEFIIGAFACVLTIFIASFIMPIVNLSRNFLYTLIALFIIFIVFLITALTAFIPYQANINAPTPQRYWMFHTNRIIHDENNLIIKSDSGIAFPNKDRNSPKMIEEYIDNYLKNSSSLVTDCDLALYCGLPTIYTSTVDELEAHVWIPIGPPVISNGANLGLISKHVFTNIVEYMFEASGTDHYNIYISPYEGMKLVSTSLLNFIPTNQPKWKNRYTYFVLYVDGKRHEPLKFSLYIEVPGGYDGSTTMDIAIAATYYDEKSYKKSTEYEQFLSNFPPWTSINAWMGTYESWKY